MRDRPLLRLSCAFGAAFLLGFAAPGLRPALAEPAPTNSVESFRAAQAFLARRVEVGVWTRADQRHLRRILLAATRPQRAEVMKRLLREINEGRLHYRPDVDD